VTMDDRHAPLEPDQLDELLSAELDGELETAALDLGVPVDEIAARILATPGAADRRIALAAARDLLAQPPELDELHAARVREAALRAAEDAETDWALRDGASTKRRGRLLLGGGAVAAAIAAIVALAAGLGTHVSPHSSASKSSSGAPVNDRAAAPGAAPSTVALGAYADARALAQAAVADGSAYRSAGSASTTTPVPGASSQQTEANPSTTTSPARKSQADAKNSASSPATTAADQLSGGRPAAQGGGVVADGSACAAPPQVPVSGSPRLRATATLSGKPVVVLVFDGANEHIVVIEDTHCKLLNVQMLR
jgi:hypothetical protein